MYKKESVQEDSVGTLCADVSKLETLQLRGHEPRRAGHLVSEFLREWGSDG